MTSRNQQFMTAAITALMVVVQCVMPLPNACGCGDDASTASESRVSDAGPSCCSQSSSCENCRTSECTCGDDCGTRQTGCQCGCNNQDDIPEPVQEPEPRGHQDVELLSSVGSGETVVAQLKAAHDAAKSSPRLDPASATPVQVLLCTWQT